jgi:acyl-CoA hydrolase
MGMLKQAKVDTAAVRAARAKHEGRSVLLVSQLHGGADLSGDAEVIEQVESQGWRLENMSHVMNTAGLNKLEAVYLFRLVP